MKNGVLILVCLAIAGCTYADDKIDGYLDDPKTLLEDPLTVDHERQLSELESRYLAQKITYAQYLEQKQQLQNGYIKDVRKREEILSDR